MTRYLFTWLTLRSSVDDSTRNQYLRADTQRAERACARVWVRQAGDGSATLAVAPFFRFSYVWRWPVRTAQTAFILGRNIYERVRSCSGRTTKGIILKFDFEKAHDKVQWGFSGTCIAARRILWNLNQLVLGLEGELTEGINRRPWLAAWILEALALIFISSSFTIFIHLVVIQNSIVDLQLYSFNPSHPIHVITMMLFTPCVISPICSCVSSSICSYEDRETLVIL
jgi:hypothetical protein